jgi:hypothetical protein
MDKSAKKESAETLWIDGADKAVIGFIDRCGYPPVVIYSYPKLCTVFVKQGMTDEEAAEWVSFNIEGAGMGAGTPGILHRGTAADVRLWIGSEKES